MVKIMLQTAAPNLASSQSFYENLGFQHTHESEHLHVYSDSSIDLIVNGNVGARPGFAVYTDNVKALAEKLTEYGPLFPHNVGHVTSDPNGIRIFLFPESCHPTLDKHQVKGKNICGNNYGAGIETTRFDESVAFWKDLGYEAGATIGPDSQYATLQQEGSIALTLFKPGICPHAFYNPSLTYFNGKEGNPVVISKLKEAGVVPVEEITVFNKTGEVDNIIISDPGGLHSFIFNDG
jgi:predicted lactoylglutathione lyase